MLIKDSLSLWLYNTIAFLGPSDHPLQISQWNLIILRVEKRFVLTTQSPIKVENPPVHVDMDHILIEESSIHDNDSHHYEDCQVDTDNTVLLRNSQKMLVEKEVVTPAPVICDAITDEY